ncbi:MAG: uracil-DNA glycosylase [Bacteroidia bacterium]
MIDLNSEWLTLLKDEFEKPYMKDLKSFLNHEQEQNHIFYPPGKHIFEALNQTPYSKVKVVIIGQDPYHGKNQAHGLSFSVNKGIPIPPSLKNIYKELQSDLGLSIPNHGNLMEWAKQGVLLLNATLTVGANSPGSHQKKGWENFTDRIIELLNNKTEPIVFLLWGNFAKGKKQFINNHLVLEAAHPSPFSAYNGFFGCKHFSQTNQFLVEKGLTPIDWQIT